VVEVVALVGPTAVGKSDLGVALAQRIGGEVVNADSMQLYRGMDIGTAKLTPAERQGVPHHLLDVLDVTETATVADYQRLARACIEEVRGRGNVPVFVGGSGLYLRGALDVLEFPGTDDAVRAELERELAQVGSEQLHARLAAVDPAAAAAILPANGRRVVRALEVVHLTGRPFSAAPGMTDYTAAYDVRWVGVAPPADLDERIAARVDRMWAAGLVAEVRELEQRGLRSGRTASRALGYQQVLAFLAGETDEATARERTVVATRRFARRQVRWFRRDPRVTWVPAELSAVLAAAAAGPDG
jgi:tRNA dimethylallyltransferase